MIELNCPSCGKMLSIPAEFRGQTGKCNGCGGPIYVPQARPKTEQKALPTKVTSPVDIDPAMMDDWRSDPASNRQLGLLADLGATPRQVIGLTKEQASILIETLQDTGPSQTMAFNSGGAPFQIVQQINVHNAPYPQHVIYAPPKSRMVYILLALFLGGLGIHNFYAGRNGSGVAQLLITVFTAWMLVPILIILVWVLLEICVVTEDGSGQRFN